VAGCGGKDGPGIVNTPTVTAVNIGTPSKNAIDIGETLQLTATVDVQNGASQQVEWSSGSPNVATVSSSGLVTGVSAGSALVTATSVQTRSKTATLSITVNPARVVGVTLNSAARSLRVGESFSVAASVDTRGPLAKTVTFSSNRTTVATVSSSDNQNATIVAVGAGVATITATSTADGSKSTSIDVTVSGAVRITGATPSPVNIRPGTTARITPTVQADAGVSTAVTFQSQNTAIATVANDGTVTAVAVGQTNVVISAVADPQQKLTVPVIVRSGVTSVNLTPDRDSLRPTQIHQLGLNVVVETGVSNTVTLSSGNTAVVTIDGSARVTGVAPGQAWVRAISTVDAAVADSTLVVVMDPCQVFPAITIGAAVNGSVSDASCQGRFETFMYRVNAQSTLAFNITSAFPGEFRYLSTLNAWWYFNLAANQPGTGTVLVAPGQYYVTVGAASVAQRGTFSLTSSANAAISSFCGITGTTGVTVTLPINPCNFQPNGRPTGAYNSYSFALLPYFVESDKLTITVQATGFIPLIELHFNALAPVVVVAPGTNTATLTYTAPAGGGFANFWVSSRDAGQTGTFTVTISGPAAGMNSLAVQTRVAGTVGELFAPARVAPAAAGLPGLPIRP